MTTEAPSGRITDALLASIRDRVPVSSVVSKHVTLTKRGREKVGLCPFHQEKTPSFSVNDSKGICKCFSCGAGGDVVDFTMAIYRMSFREAVTALASEHGLDGSQVAVDPKLLERNEQKRKADEAKTRGMLEYVEHLWHGAKDARESPVEKYLRNRLIAIPIPPSIRFHPEVSYPIADRKRLYLPAMISQFTDANGSMIAAHLTFIMRDGTGKANVEAPKKILGNPSGGGIYLGPVSDEMQIVEGVETGLSLQGISTIAAGNTSLLMALRLPEMPYCRRLTIGADNDANRAGEKAAIAAATRFREEGREVKIIKPRGFKDYNDLVRSVRSGGPGI
jgi:DNA primase